MVETSADRHLNTNSSMYNLLFYIIKSMLYMIGNCDLSFHLDITTSGATVFHVTTKPELKSH